MISPLLKKYGYIALICAFVCAVVWMIVQHREGSSLEEETARLEKALAAKPEGYSSKASKKGSPAGKPVSASSDWKNLLSKLERNPDKDIEAELQFTKALKQMKPDELEEVLNEIIALNVSTDRRSFLALATCRALLSNNPVNGLETISSPKYTGIWNDVSADYSLHYALGKWASKDTDMACAWLDRIAAEGRFGDKTLEQVNKARLGFEIEVTKHVWKSNPDRIRQRLSLLSEKESDRVVGSLFTTKIEEPQWKTYAGIVRDFLPKENSNGAIASCAWLSNGQNYENTSRFLDAISASDEERHAAIRYIAQSKISRLKTKDPQAAITEIDGLRSWARDKHPELDKVTGRSLAFSIGADFSFEQAAQIAIHYQEQTGRDDMLLGFFSHEQIKDVEKARELASRIKDPEVRASVIKQLE